MASYVVDWPTFLSLPTDGAEVVFMAAMDDKETFFLVQRDAVLFFDQKSLSLYFKCERSEECIRARGSNNSCCLNSDSTSLALTTELGYLILINTVADVSDSRNSTQTIDFPSEELLQKRRIWETATRVILNVGSPAVCVCLFGEFLVVTSIYGGLSVFSWDGHLIHVFLLKEAPFYHDIEYSKTRRLSDPSIYCQSIEWAPTLGGLLAILSTGDIALLRIQENEQNNWMLDGIRGERLEQPVSLAVNNRFRTAAVGTASADVALYRMDDTTGALFVEQYLRVSNREYPDASNLVGSVNGLAWSPDGYTLAVAWTNCGWALWSVFGGLLHTSLGERIGLADRVRLSHLAWSASGYHLLGFLSFEPSKSYEHCVPINKIAMADPHSVSTNQHPVSSIEKHETTQDVSLHDVHLAVFHIARSSLTVNPTLDNHSHVLLQTEDRVIFASRDQLNDTRAPQTLLLPQLYIRHNWPLRFVAVSTDGERVVVSGNHGFAHYNFSTKRWNVFGNEMQERSMQVYGGIVWWKHFICCCCYSLNHDEYEVRVYPSDQRLDNQFSSVHRVSTMTEPLLVDCLGNLFTLLTSNGRVHILRLSHSSRTGRKGVRVHIDPLQLIDLTNLIRFPGCVVRLCLSTLTANLPHSLDVTNHLHRSRPAASSISDPAEACANDLPDLPTSPLLSTRSESDLSSREFRPRSLLVNYAGYLFLLQPSMAPDSGLCDPASPVGKTSKKVCWSIDG
ncbi:hypothetical protein PHET_08603 [Paragonimus heterotremus]|uniref:Protein RIC1 homolog n=1 Tax=Paragonimus heterotremus TaxID=100268 RepID=A0A8J4WG29_9TREM|nr:hypothetical protein PHET_08603 [Paragonimus heterotremus]